MFWHRLKTMALPPEDKRILLASVLELQECINEIYVRDGANGLFMELVSLIDERIMKLDENFDTRHGDSGTSTPDW